MPSLLCPTANSTYCHILYIPSKRSVYDDLYDIECQIKILQKEEIRFPNRTDIKLQLRNARQRLQILKTRGNTC